jgi:hypothetical protein
MFETFMGIFQSKDAPNPHDVPNAIVKLVNDAKGSRLARVVVGQPYGADAVNRQVEPIQTQVIEGLGLGLLTKLK